MGSVVRTSSVATDNRLAVTDNALGLSSSGTGNNATIAGDIFNISAGGGAVRPGTGGTGGNINFSVLDGGAINRAFDFAENSLSDMLESVLSGQKATQAATQYQAETIGASIAKTAQISAETAKENNKSIIQFLTDNMQKLAFIAGLAAVGYVYFKGRK